MPRFSVMPNHNPGGSGFMVWDSTEEELPVWYGFENAATAYADARNAEDETRCRDCLGSGRARQFDGVCPLCEGTGMS